MKEKISKLVDGGSNNWNEKKRNLQHGMDRQGRTKKNKIKHVGIDKCENIDSFYINKIIKPRAYQNLFKKFLTDNVRQVSMWLTPNTSGLTMRACEDA